MASKRTNTLPYHLMLLPGVLLVLVFSYVPIYGVVIAFQRFIPARGMFGDQAWVGLGNFEYLLALPTVWQVFANTLIIAILKIAGGTVLPIVVSLLLNEVHSRLFRRTVQTIIYFPYFISWIVFGGIMVDLLSPNGGIVNQVIVALGFEPVYFLGDVERFRGTLVVTDVWKTFGFITVIYLAAITSIDPTLYEVASIDGAGRWQKAWHITLPGMGMVIVLLMVLNLGNILNAGFGIVLSLVAAVCMSPRRIGGSWWCGRLRSRNSGRWLANLEPWWRVYQWGLVAGRTQTWLHWYTRYSPEPGPEPRLWLHDVIRPDGSLFDPAEAAALREHAGEELALEPMPMTAELMAHLEELGLIIRLRPGGHDLAAQPGETLGESIYETANHYGPHKLIAVTVNRAEFAAFGTHPGNEEFLLIGNPDSQPMYLAVALCMREELEEKVRTGRLTAADFVMIECRYNDPGTSFFVMRADVPHGEAIVPVAGKPPPSFYVTESRDLPLNVIDLRKYRLGVAT